jgi:predicted ester cyclase
MNAEENLRLMKSLDDAWNAQDWETFSQRHMDDVIVRWPNKQPTEGIDAHRMEAEYFFRSFPDNHIDNDPYKVLIAQGDWTCSVAEFTGTHEGILIDPDGKSIPATNKKFKVDFCTVARWKEKKIVEENLFYDLVGMMRQLDLTWKLV